MKTRNTQRTQQAAYTHVHTHLEQLVQVWRREGDAPKHQGVQACTQSVHVGGSASISRIGLHHLRCEEGRGAVAALKILISGGEDLRTAEDIPMCLHSCVCVCVCVGLHQFGCEEGRGAVAALEILISGGGDLRTAEDIPMCLHFCVCVCVFVCVCVLGFIILGARNAGVPLQCSRYSFPVAKICPQLRTFQCACILLCMCVLDFVILGARNAGPCYCSS